MVRVLCIVLLVIATFLASQTNGQLLYQRCSNVTKSNLLFQGTRFDNNLAFSYTFWFKPTAVSNVRTNIIHKGDSDSENFVAMHLVANSLKLQVRLSTTVNANDGCDPTTALDLNLWTHISATYDGTRLFTVYFNGEIVCQKFISNAKLNKGPLYLGDPWSAPAVGTIADFEIKESLVPVDKIKEKVATELYNDCANPANFDVPEEVTGGVYELGPLGTFKITQVAEGQVQAQGDFLAGVKFNEIFNNCYLIKKGNSLQAIKFKIGGKFELSSVIPILKGTPFESFGISADAYFIVGISLYRDPELNNMKIAGPGVSFVVDISMDISPLDVIKEFLPVPTRIIGSLIISTSSVKIRIEFPFSVGKVPLRFTAMFVEVSASIGNIFLASKNAIGGGSSGGSTSSGGSSTGSNSASGNSGTSSSGSTGSILSPTLSLGVVLEFKPGDTILFITGRITIGLKSATGALSMEGMWEDVFGITGFSLGNIAVEIGIEYEIFAETGLPSIFGFTGQISIGRVAVRIAIKFNLEFTDFGLFASLERFTLYDVIDFMNMLLDVVSMPNIPKQVLPEIGIYGVEVKIAPKYFSIGEIGFPQGFTLKGEFRIEFGGKVLFFLLLNFNIDLVTMGPVTFPLGITAQASMSKIDFFGIIVINGRGLDGVWGTIDDGPTFSLELNTKAQKLMVSGEISLFNDGAYVKVDVSVSFSGINIMFAVKLFDFFQASFECALTTSPFDFMVKMTFGGDFINWIIDGVKGAVTFIIDLAKKVVSAIADGVSKFADKIASAAKKVASWAKKILDLQRMLATAQKVVGALQTGLNKAVSAIKKVGNIIKDGVVTVVKKVVDAVGDFFEDVGDALNPSNWAGVGYANTRALAPMAHNAGRTVSAQAGLGDVFDSIKGAVSSVAGKIRDLTSRLTSAKFWKGVADKAKSVLETAKDAFVNKMKSIKDIGEAIVNAVPKFWDLLTGWYIDPASYAQFQLSKLIKEFDLGKVFIRFGNKPLGRVFDFNATLNLKNPLSFFKAVASLFFEIITGGKKSTALPDKVDVSTPTYQEPTGDATVLIRDGVTVGFRGTHLKYLSAHNNNFKADGVYFQRDEKFILEKKADGQYALRTSYDKYVCALDNLQMISDRTVASTWETFTVEMQDNFQVALKTYHKRHVTAKPEGTVEAVQPGIFAWELFDVVEYVEIKPEIPVIIRSRLNNKCMDQSSPTQKGVVWMWDCHGGSNQAWYWDGLQIKNRAGNRCLDIEGASKNSKAKLQVYDCHDGENQMWYWDGSQIKSLSNDLCIDIDGANTGIKARLQMYPCHGKNNQQWYSLEGRTFVKTSAVLRTLEVGDEDIAIGVTKDNNVWEWDGTSWVRHSNMSMKYVSASHDDNVWGVDLNNQVFKWDGDSWEPMPGKPLKQISVGNVQQIVGVADDCSIWKWNGKSWFQIPGCKIHVSIGPDGSLWGVNDRREIYRYKEGSTNWDRIAGSLKMLTVANRNYVYGVNDNNNVYVWRGSQWDQVPGQMAHVSVGADGEVWGVAPDGSVHHME